MWKGRHQGRDVAAKVLRLYSLGDLERARKVSWPRLATSVHELTVVQRFCEEVVVWGALRHPNILRLLGVTMSENRFVIVSEWMVGGDVNEFVKVHPGVNRLELVRSFLMVLIFARH